MINVEKQFRSSNPSKLLPHWLADHNLRGEGSTITTARFLAVADNEEKNATGESLTGEDQGLVDMKSRLRTTVGRMLWTEVWGQYVTAETWWWEDEDCIRECWQLNTHWEYHLIEAVKDI